MCVLKRWPNWEGTARASKAVLANARYVRAVLTEASRPLTLGLLLLSLFGGVASLAEVLAITRLIDEIAAFAGWFEPYGEVVLHFLPSIAILVGAMLFQQYAAALRPYLSACLQEKVTLVMHRRTFLKSMRLRLESFESDDYYNKLERAARAQGQIVRALEAIGAAAGAFMQFLVVFYAVSRLSAAYAALFVVCCIPVFFFHMQSDKRFVEVTYKQSPTRRKQGYWRNLATSRQSAAELRLFQLGEFVMGKWRQYTAELVAELWQARKKQAMLSLKGDSAFYLFLLIMMGAASHAGVQGAASLGEVVSALYLLDRLQQAMTSATSSFSALTQFHLQFQTVPEYLEIDEEERGSGAPAPQPMREGIRFDNVSFVYPGQSRPALERVSFHLRPGERIALAGENGAGKSTLCLLLLGLYKPTEGRITVDGVDLAEIDLAEWRNAAAAVFQQFVRYQLTAAENIGFGSVERIAARDEVVTAAMQGGIHEAIDRLPGRYDTLLGKQYEESQDLSGGQWQKVAISRACFRDAELLILDEPAAALDAYSEHEVYRQFRALTEGKTALIVSHRLGSARLADRILFLKDGRLTETGTHEQLLSTGGEYAALFRMQSQWYAEDRKEGHALVE